jgi:hypothetical protein
VVRARVVQDGWRFLVLFREEPARLDEDALAAVLCHARRAGFTPPAIQAEVYLPGPRLAAIFHYRLVNGRYAGPTRGPGGYCCREYAPPDCSSVRLE